MFDREGICNSRAGVRPLWGGSIAGVVAPDATLLEGLLALRISLLCSSRSVDGFLDILPDLVVVPDASEVGESVVLTGLCTSYPAGALG